MNCPHCNRKVESDTRLCGYCHKPLDIPDSGPEFVTLIETFNLGQMLLIKSVLEAEDMDYYVLGETANSMMAHPLPYIVRVSAEQAEVARELLGDMIWVKSHSSHQKC